MTVGRSIRGFHGLNGITNKETAGSKETFGVREQRREIGDFSFLRWMFPGGSIVNPISRSSNDSCTLEHAHIQDTHI